MKQENYIIKEVYLSTNDKINLPHNFSLGQNYPNPFNPITYIQFMVPVYDRVKMEVLNIHGQKICTIIDNYHQPGSYQVSWDGTNDLGNSVPTGIYFYRLESFEYVITKKLILLK